MLVFGPGLIVRTVKQSIDIVECYIDYNMECEGG